MYLYLTKKLQPGPTPAVDLNYHAPAAPPAKPCAPPKLTLMQRMKLRVEGVAIQQAAKADTKITKTTRVPLNGAATDAAITAVQQANPPCLVQPKQ